ncbi:MAG: poly(3-hydroxyalkanoate) depolymerase [Verrucomicrobia bacterium]|nr:poly(3-hydroxyalkanoate) depolymerase [Verrucomicrobiota bacterium]
MPPHRFLETEGNTLRVAFRPGDPARPALLMFNGIGASLELLDPLVEALDPAIPVVRLDPPGIGGSAAPRWPYRFPGLARMAADVCDQLGLGALDVFGVSWGGAVAQEFAHQFGARTQHLILAATSPGMIALPGSPSALLEMAGPLRKLLPRSSQPSSGVVFGGDFRQNSAVVRGLTRWIAGAGSPGYYLQGLAGLGWTSAHWLRTLRMPALVLAGEDDPLVPLANAKLLVALLPHARLVRFDCGHLFVATRAAAVAREIARFVAPTPQ